LETAILPLNYARRILSPQKERKGSQKWDEIQMRP
jgi:hypothetical protein